MPSKTKFLVVSFPKTMKANRYLKSFLFFVKLFLMSYYLNFYILYTSGVANVWINYVMSYIAISLYIDMERHELRLSSP